ncbi:MAG: 3-phosphoshikimate 1-carboxyvinyltransferase [Anaerolineaceae bacterium]|nr:3-phosphoshikimate 1-carboxyvinyltransferase [Anaerolineaceae bacterium]
MNLISKSANPLTGSVSAELPGDKSISHRAALFAAFADGTSRIEHFQVSGVTRPMLQALTSFGIQWSLDGETLTVEGRGISAWKNPTFPIDCGNSATTLRLLAGAIAGAGVTATLDGSYGLRRRPMDRIVEPLRKMGAVIKTTPGGIAPLTIQERAEGQKLKPLTYDLPVASAQVKSCLLLAALGAEGTTLLNEPGPSRDHTERMLSSMGATVKSYEVEAHNTLRYMVELTPPNPLKLLPLNMSLPADPSAAAFLIVAALIIPGSSLTLKGVCLNPTRTGLLDALQAMGADINLSNQHDAGGELVGDLQVNASELQGTEVSGSLVVRMIDEFPIFAIAAAVANGTTTVHDAKELRLKESDRIAMLAAELRLLGVEIEEHSDGFTIHGGKLQGGTVDSHGDHRLAMSLAIAGLAAESSVTIRNAECTAESFPAFAQILQKLGAVISTEG